MQQGADTVPTTGTHLKNGAAYPPVAKPKAPKIQRSFDAARVNAFLNSEDIRPWIADMAEGKVDVTKHVENRDNVCLLGEHGGTLCFKLMHGIYEVHTFVCEAGRGPWALGMVRAGSRYMFTRTDAYEIVTRVPHSHRAAAALTATAGMRFEMSLPDACRFEGVLSPVNVYSFRIQDWIAKADAMEAVGRQFHADMIEAARAAGVTAPAHDDDPIHNRYVGAAYEMFRAGQLVKGAEFYNRWAMIARHAPIRLIDDKPPTIKFDIGIMRLLDKGRLEVVPC